MAEDKTLTKTEKRIVLFVIFILTIGVFFRFYNLDGKVFWRDEAATLFRISGHSESEFLKNFSYDTVASTNSLQKYQKPDAEKQNSDLITNLAKEEPQLSPLYFLALRGWISWFGNSIASIRSLSALFSLFCFPSLYWLCMELFESRLAAWIGVSLFSVSPFYVLFAQEARPYSLFTLATILSSAALLRAIKFRRKVDWFIYTATITLGIYSYLLFGLVVAVHGAYVVVCTFYNRVYSRKVFFSYVTYSILGVFFSVPWLFMVAVNLSKIPQLKRSEHQKDFLNAFRELVGSIRQTFFDLNYGTNSVFNFSDLFQKAYPILNLLFIALLLYSIYMICRRTAINIWSFVLLLTSTSLVLLMGNKFLPRYSSVTSLGAELLVAYLIASKIKITSISYARKATLRRYLWTSLLAILLLMGTASCYVSAHLTTWWNKLESSNMQVASIINKSFNPLVVSDSTFDEILSLSHYLSRGHFQINPQCYFCYSGLKLQQSKIPKIPDNFSDIFLFNPSENLKKNLEKRYKMSLVSSAHLSTNSWRLENRT
jgi:uncharacterized membrane protein